MAYKKPPENYRFIKGKTGNPYGRPKRIDKEFSDICIEIFDLIVSARDGCTPSKMKLKHIKNILNI